MSNETALVVIEKKDVATVFTAEGYEAFIKRCRDEALSVVQDISTEAGRDAIRSMAYKVARTKTTFDNLGKELKAEHKAKCDAIDADRNKGVAALQALQDEVRKPLTEWENKEKARVDGHEQALIELATWKNWSIANASGVGSTQDELKNALAKSKELVEGRDWQEFSARAAMQLISNEEALNAAIAKRIIHDEDCAKAELIRKQEEEANETAVIASNYVLTELMEHTQASVLFHQELKAAEERKQREFDSEMQTLSFYAIVFDKSIQEGIDRKKAEDAAAQKVLDDAAAAKKKEDDAAAEREKDKNHKKKINNEALDAIEEIYGAYHGEKNEELCRKIVEAIARGKVPHVSIKY